MAAFAFLTLLFALGAILFLLHRMRVRGIRGPFAAYVAGLWFFTFVLGSGGYRLESEWLGLHFQLRLSTAAFVLIFSAILMAYICEGIQSTRELISVSVGSLVFVGIIELILPLINELRGSRGLLEAQLQPSYLRMAASLCITIFDLFFAIAFFQFIWNLSKGRFLYLLLFLSLAVPMAIDSVLFLATTRPSEFSTLIVSHLLFKIPLCALIALPMALYVRSFQKAGQLDLDRGSLDILKKIKGLEEDLRVAHEELKRYALNLEQMVDDRTAELKQKQALLDMELAMAQEVQASSLPAPGRISDLQVAARYLPASSVSGDVYEYGSLSERECFFFIADISGHGVPAALIGSMCKMLLASLDLKTLGPAGVLREIAGSLKPFSGNHYLTAFVAFVDRSMRDMVYASGAHVPALLSAGNKTVELPATGSLVAGVVPPEFEQKRVKYPQGARLVLYTDGISEHRNEKREEFGMDRFRAALLAAKAESPELAAVRIMNALEKFGAGALFKDDVTLVIADI